MQKRTMELRSPERRQFNCDWASPVSSKLEQSNLGRDPAGIGNPFSDEVSRNMQQSIDRPDMIPASQPQQRIQVESQLMQTTNFSDVLAGRSTNFAEHQAQHPAMERSEIATERNEPSNIVAATGNNSLDKLDALEQMALEALDDL